MKLKLIYSFFLLALFKETYCQHNADLNLILIIDDRIVKKGVSDGFIEVKRNSEDPSKKIEFKHIVGKLMMTTEDYTELSLLDTNTVVSVNFKYHCLNPEKREYEYSKEIFASWLIQPYVIFRVYNFANKKNRKSFREKEGYGIDIEIPSKAILIPRKRARKNVVRDCN